MSGLSPTSPRALLQPWQIQPRKAPVTWQWSQQIWPPRPQISQRSGRGRPAIADNFLSRYRLFAAADRPGCRARYARFRSAAGLSGISLRKEFADLVLL